MIGAQSALFWWKKKDKRSYELVSLSCQLVVPQRLHWARPATRTIHQTHSGADIWQSLRLMCLGRLHCKIWVWPSWAPGPNFKVVQAAVSRLHSASQCKRDHQQRKEHKAVLGCT